MRKGIVFALLACTTASLCAIDSESGQRYTITGLYITTQQANSEDDINDKALEVIPPTVTVTRKHSIDDSRSEPKQLASGRFESGKVFIEGEIDESTEIVISVKTADGTGLSIDALIVPSGANVSFVLLEGGDPTSHRLALHGSSLRSKVPANRFTVKGDISELSKDLSNAKVGVLGSEYVAGNKVIKEFGTVILDDGSFVIEADVHEPRIVDIYVQGSSIYSTAQAVIEPDSEILLAWREGTSQLLATAKSGRHVDLVESWQQSDEYLELVDAYSVSYAQFIAELQSKSTETSNSQEEKVSEADKEGEENSETASQTIKTLTEEDAGESEQSEDVMKALESLAPQVAHGCEHVEVDDVRPISIGELLRNRGGPEHFKLSQKMDKMRTEALQYIAKNSEDPIDVLLAMELEAFGFYDENRNEALPIYDNLASTLDDDFVARRVMPRRKSLARFITKEDNDQRLIPGQKVLDVTLPNLQGEDVSLYDVLAENGVVLIDFWASWCGPCIAAFPEMKRLYAAYRKSGFEVFSVSIDRTADAWEEGSEEHDLPWINLGENKGWEGPVASAFGIQLIPKNYLVDSKGCILKKMISTDAVEELLVARFGSKDEFGDSNSKLE